MNLPTQDTSNSKPSPLPKRSSIQPTIPTHCESHIPNPIKENKKPNRENKMKAIRNAYATTQLTRNAFLINPNLTTKPSLFSPPTPTFRPPAPFRFFTCSHPPMDDGPTIGSQFETFRAHLDESSSLRDRIKNVAMEIESASRIMHANLLLVHQSRPLSEVLERANTQISVIKEHFNRLAAIVKESPGQYYRFHNDWKSETQTVVSLLTFMHWLDTGLLLMHHETQEKLGLNTPDFSLDVEDYLVGVCFMSNELPRYVVNRVTYGDYDCPSKVLNFLTDLHASFRMLNLRNDFLRKKFDGMKYDLKRVEEVYYDVKIRGLVDKVDTKVDEAAQAKP